MLNWVCAGDGLSNNPIDVIGLWDNEGEKQRRDAGSKSAFNGP
jgi:hypothetical protein